MFHAFGGFCVVGYFISQLSQISPIGGSFANRDWKMVSIGQVFSSILQILPGEGLIWY